MPSPSSTLQSSADSAARTWDGSPQTKYEWFESLQHSLTSKNVSFRTLWQSGYVVDRAKVLVTSEMHGKHLSIANVDRQAFNSPCKPLKFTVIDATKDVSGVPFDGSRYVVAPEMLDAVDRSLFAAIADTIDNKKRRDDYDRKADGSGLRLIGIIAEEINQASTEISQWAARRLADVVSAGLTAPTTVGFDQFRKQYEEANAQLPPTRRNAESVVADTYVSVVRQLGDNLGTRLDMQLTMAKLAKGGKALDLHETVSCILDILGDQELRHTGHALKLNRDARNKPLVWTEGKHELCSICKGKHGGGRHLRRDCPDKPTDPIKKLRSDRSGERDQAPKGSAKRAAASDVADDDVELQNLWEGDTPLSALFADYDELPHSSPTDSTNDSTSGDGEGVALMVKQGGTVAPDSQSTPTTPVHVPLSEARRLIDSLSPASPMKEFAEVERAVGSGVSLRTGGSDRRSRIDILGEMRSAVGLSPAVIPVGLPVGPTVVPPNAPPQPSTQPQTSTAPSTRPARATTEVRPTPPTPSTPDTPDRPGARAVNLQNPLGIVWEPGALELKGFHIRVNTDGLIVHEYEFDEHPGRTWTHPAGSLVTATRPPSRSVFLGRSCHQQATCWGSESGELVLCTTATPSPSPSTPQPPTNSQRRNVTRDTSSPVRNVTIAVLSLAGALAAMALGAHPSSSNGQLELPFDPGERHVLNPSATALIVLFASLIGARLARQANAGRGRRTRSADRRPTAPADCSLSREAYYSKDIELSRQRMRLASHGWRRLTTLWFAASHYLVLLGLCWFASRLGLTASTHSHRRPLLPTPELHWPPLHAATAASETISIAVSYSLLLSTYPLVTLAATCVWMIHLEKRSARCSRRLIFVSSNRTRQPQPSPFSMHSDHASVMGKALRSARARTEGEAKRWTSRQRRRTPMRSTADRPRSSESENKWTSAHSVRKWLDLVIDSGCTWHVHNQLDDLVNVKMCGDVVEDAAGNRIVCTRKGDLPLIIRSEQGVEFQFLLRDVRWAPSFPDSLVSVDQLWQSSKVDCVFRNQLHLAFTLNHTHRNEPLTSAFRRIDGLYRWTVGVAGPSRATAAICAPPHSKQLKHGIHAAGSTSHVASLPAASLAALMHRRLHVGLDSLRRLGELTIDAPIHIQQAPGVTCPHCTEANAARLSHPHSSYRPTHVGRLIHMDIAGPFKPSAHGGHRYMMVLVDDHSRYKFVYFIHRRSDAREKVKKFVAQMASLASENSAAPINKVGKLRSDNAGEFVALEFSEMLDDLGVHQSTSPPHVHQLNGVAERAIRSVLSLTRSYLTASGLTAGHWTHAAEMAVDVLNRTSGPQNSRGGQSSYEMMTGRQPRILGLMPFGCRAFAVKPREQYSKTTLEPRAWVGVNLGRSALSPNAFKIWCPSIGRVVVTSDAYFMEHLYPCRPKGDQVDDSVSAVPTRPEPDPERHAEQSSGRALSVGRESDGDRPRRALLLFSGSYARPDGLAAMLRRRGIETVCVDNDPSKGSADHDILTDSFFLNLLERARRGDFDCVFAAPPCSTYSVARFFKPKGASPGAPVVRSREHVLGLPNLPSGHNKEVHLANETTRRTCAILSAAGAAGADFAIKNPADRGDAAVPHLFHFAEHAPIWLDPHMVALQKTHHLSSVTFAQCMMGGDSQKYTTLWYTAGLATLDNLRGLHCRHAPGAHARTAGGEYDEVEKTWNSAQAAAYPADFNALLAEALTDAIASNRIVHYGEPHRTPRRPRESPDVSHLIDTSAALTQLAHPSTQRQPESSSLTAGSQGELPTRSDPPQEPIDPASSSEASSPDDSTTPAASDVPSPVDMPKRKYQRRVFNIRENADFGLRPRNFAKLAGSAGKDPINHAEAMKQDAIGWGEAESTEIANHETNESWTYMPRDDLPQGRRIVKLTWVFKTKRGESKKKKARLCVQGCSQVHGEDFDQTFCAAMRAGSLRTLCATASRLSLQMFRWDFVAAYLQGELEPGEVVYCSPPAGFATALLDDGKVHMVPIERGDGVRRLCKVVRPVYGMAQAGRRWQRTLFPWLLDWENGGAKLTQSKHDTCVFHCKQTVHAADGVREETLLIGCYVDDLFILASHTDSQSLYHRFTRDLSDRWDVEDEGPVSDLLSIEIDRVDDKIRLRQSGYITKLMDTYAPDGRPATKFATLALSSQPPARTPCGPELPQHVADALTQDAGEINKDLLKAYQSITGALLYCAVNTRPDVAYAVGMLCRAMGKPTELLLNDAYRVLYYLHHHKHAGLYYSACELDLRGLSDADWATHYSTSGFVFMFSQAAISWSSKKQPCVSLSSCEAEIVALSEAAKEGVYLSRFLEGIGLAPSGPVKLATDNSAARDLSYNPEHHERTKHIERRHFFVRDMVESHQLVVPYVSTTENLADFFTKPPPAADFYRHRNAIMNLPPRSESTIGRAGGC